MIRRQYELLLDLEKHSEELEQEIDPGLLGGSESTQNDPEINQDAAVILAEIGIGPFILLGWTESGKQ
ncbi:hypothetical protein NIE88_16380 [Sporolactobacillus shoreicorticis]|uniref:Uncharacterized protein n=1 Tax=Sporolactobacillus shoreicorticis TaxID=1923877 RepID=A0ABW5S4L4_9BACL|nr:hypothetical protein [Sporolactobacillus shoreicorticis]MCO7127348.1 hypothetical protein [Sporolactobacillus shoreicorticis]